MFEARRAASCVKKGEERRFAFAETAFFSLSCLYMLRMRYPGYGLSLAEKSALGE